MSSTVMVKYAVRAALFLEDFQKKKVMADK